MGCRSVAVLLAGDDAGGQTYSIYVRLQEQCAGRAAATKLYAIVHVLHAATEAVC
jgi:hypothetical protein